jgi:hypothetical protein
MTAILDLPEVRQRVSPLSVEEYSRLDEYNENGKRTELIRGIVIEKMSKSPCIPVSRCACLNSSRRYYPQIFTPGRISHYSWRIPSPSQTLR